MFCLFTFSHVTNKKKVTKPYSQVSDSDLTSHFEKTRENARAYSWNFLRLNRVNIPPQKIGKL